MDFNVTFEEKNNYLFIRMKITEISYIQIDLSNVDKKSVSQVHFITEDKSRYIVSNSQVFYEDYLSLSFDRALISVKEILFSHNINNVQVIVDSLKNAFSKYTLLAC